MDESCWQLIEIAVSLADQNQSFCSRTVGLCVQYFCLSVPATSILDCLSTVSTLRLGILDFMNQL